MSVIISLTRANLFSRFSNRLSTVFETFVTWTTRFFMIFSLRSTLLLMNLQREFSVTTFLLRILSFSQFPLSVFLFLKGGYPRPLST